MILLLRRTLLLSVILCSIKATAQLGVNKNQFTHADTLRGTLNENRTWWDVLRYDITVKPNFETKEIEGNVKIVYSSKMVFDIKNKEKDKIKAAKIILGKDAVHMQIDLQQPLIIDSIITDDFMIVGSHNKMRLEGTTTSKLNFTRTDNVAIINMTGNHVVKNPGATKDSITIYYHGKPREAIRPPWDGGWIWKKDDKGRPWISVAVQGLGASAWYPCKDHQSDEPDNGASLTIIVPDSLMAVGNGRLIKQTHLKDYLLPDDIVFASADYVSKKPTKEDTINHQPLGIYRWEVKNPINNYNIIPYIGKYVNFTDTLMGLKGKLDLSYWVLDYNVEKAKEQFKQAKLMLRAFEYWFGPYPFYEDGYKLVEAPHLGMEHQSAVAYGNKYQNGYLGRDLSGTGWGNKWDFIIVHESGHEWFANSITSKDLADMWVHEGFTNYSETLFTEYYYGKEAGTDYNVGSRRSIRNDIPIIGPYGVNKEGSGDMYPKSGAMLHSIRHAIDNDEKFRQILIGLNKTFYHKTVTTQEIEAYINQESSYNFSKIFDQYLRTVQIPTLEFYKDSIASTLTIKYSSCVEGFNLPVVITSTHKKIIPSEKWQTIQLNAEELQWFTKANIERMFYIKTKQLEAKP